MVRPCVARGLLDLADVVLHQCIRPVIGARAPDHHGYQRACDLIIGRPQWASWVTSVRARREGRSSIPSHPLADLGGRGWVEGKNVRPRPTLPGDCTARGASECRIWVNLAIFTMSPGSPLYPQYSPCSR